MQSESSDMPSAEMLVHFRLVRSVFNTAPLG